MKCLPLIFMVLQQMILNSELYNCPKFCRCYRRDVVCNDVIPASLPADIRKFVINGNAVCNLTSDILSFKPSLYDVEIGCSSISLTSASFRGVSPRYSFTMYADNLSTIPLGIFDDMKNVMKIDLAGSQISYLPPQLFLNQKHLWKLDLAANRLTNISADTFVGLTCLKVCV